MSKQKTRQFHARQTYYLGGVPFVTGGRVYYETVKWVEKNKETIAHPTGHVIDDSETVWEIGTPEFKRMFIEV